MNVRADGLGGAGTGEELRIDGAAVPRIEPHVSVMVTD